MAKARSQKSGRAMAKSATSKAKATKAKISKAVTSKVATSKAGASKAARRNVKKASVSAKQASPRKAVNAVSAPAGIVVITTNPRVTSAMRAIAPDAIFVNSFQATEGLVKRGARLAFIDAEACGPENCYEVLRKLRVRSSLRLVLLHSAGSRMEPSLLALARFAGAECVLNSPPTAAAVRAILAPSVTQKTAVDSIRPGGADHDQPMADIFRARLMREIANPHDPVLLDAISDPETRLHSSAYGAFALDAEFKRATRFAIPLSVAIVGFEGEASTETMLEIAGIFLNEVRDTDTLARFGTNSFLFVMPNTLADGAKVMLERVARSVVERGLKDVVGDQIQLTSGVAGLEIPVVEGRAEFFSRVQLAFDAARRDCKAAVVR